MKCIKNVDGTIRRVKDDVAMAHVKSNDWEFIPKSEWKAFKNAKAAEKKKADSSKGQKKNKQKPQPSEKSNE